MERRTEVERVKDARSRVDKKLAEFEAARKAFRKEHEAHKEALKTLLTVEKVRELTQGVATAVQETAHKQITSVVNRSLQAIFDDPYEFKINFERKRGRTEAALVFERDGFELDPLTAAGGGVVDVASFTLRLSCLLLCRPELRRALVFDEPFKNLSEDYLPRLCNLIESLSMELGVQLVMVTHMNTLKIGKIIKV